MINIGHQFPLHTAAPAKVMLAFLPLEEADAIIETIQFKRFTEMTITNPLQFRAELENIRNSGYSVDRGEEVDSLRCVAAPIFNHRGYPLASIWATGPSYRMRDGDFEWMARYTVDCAARISQSFGYSLLDDTLSKKRERLRRERNHKRHEIHEQVRFENTVFWVSLQLLREE